MENESEWTFWKNYQTAMQWVQSDASSFVPVEETEEDEFAIDDELLEFYRHTKDHRANRSQFVAASFPPRRHFV